MSTADKRKKILHCLKLMDDGGSSKVAESEPAEPEPVDDDDDEPKDADEHVQDKSDPRLRELQEELDRYKAREKVQQRKAKARALCLEADLHPDLVTSVFLEQVARASTEQQMKALIEDRRVLSGRKPVSRGPGGGKKKVTLDEFCEELGVA